MFQSNELFSDVSPKIPQVRATLCLILFSYGFENVSAIFKKSFNPIMLKM